MGWGTSLQGWVLVEGAAQSGTREQREAGLGQLREGLATVRATGAEIWVPLFLDALAQGYAQGGQAEDGLSVVAEALALVEKNEERWNEAELYRLRGELTLAHEGKRQKSKIPDPKSQIPSRSRRMLLESYRDRVKATSQIPRTPAVMSLVRLRQSQATQDASRTTQHKARTRLDEAHKMLSEIYGWFTEGFETVDLKEAKALLESLD